MLHRNMLQTTARYLGVALALSSAATAATTVESTILILARTNYDAESVGFGLEAYGIPFEKLIVPQTGVTLPVFNSSLSQGNYGGIVTVSNVGYDYNSTWRSALTDNQWNDIYAYQSAFNVRLVRLDEYPSTEFGTTTAISGSGCCAAGVEQLISFSDTTAFPTANLKTNAGITTIGLWHYPATIANTTTTKGFAKFAPAGSFTQETVAGVINTYSNRQQMVFFISWATDWSSTSNYLQHSYIHWITRGLFVGKRKVHLNAQVDDVQLSTTLYLPNNTDYKIVTADLDEHVKWTKDITTRMPAGSSFRLELGHNGNGDIIAATNMNNAENVCTPPYAVDYTSPADTPLEFMKPLGTGVDLWPAEFQNYTWSQTCAKLDSFASWFLNKDNLNSYAHVSHTFTHEELNNATYADASREIYFNQAWLKQMGIDQATHFSPQGLIPPAITGLHNGDAIRAWLDNGLKHAMGDNTRPILLNPNSKFWPLPTTIEGNGATGLYIIPRYATTIYYNCHSPECTLQEWKDTSAGQGDFQALLNNARLTNTRYLLGLQADPYMFHQANMGWSDGETHTIGDQTGKMSLIMTWVETVVQEMVRLTNWPITSQTIDETAAYFINRMTLDACAPKLAYQYAADGKSISSVTVKANGNTCSVPVPVTIPAGSASGSGTITEDKVGSEPLILWVTLNGSPVELSLSQAVTL